ncbi:hypothetical protein MSG28_010248 [Choristoneura fumiferana]|uniref:Uncharacterized protein n=1 Tax=Choristoneura fumiferana TaxID=7141 RepID=A0ACC0KKL0_CHOFU|nr:hypothetical protein MSG28_010248 [Choristoneura fumiferana]
MVIWDLKGQKLDTLDTYLMSTYSAKISPCGRFVVATGQVTDIKVMEVCFTKTGEYKQVTKAYDLTGHSSGIYDVAFDVDTSHVATISKDGTWKLYHTKGSINHMKFDASGKYLFVCGDRVVRILHNVCGYQTTIDSCTRLLATKQTSATTERLNKTIKDCKVTLAKFGK